MRRREANALTFQRKDTRWRESVKASPASTSHCYLSLGAGSGSQQAQSDQSQRRGDPSCRIVTHFIYLVVVPQHEIQDFRGMQTLAPSHRRCDVDPPRRLTSYTIHPYPCSHRYLFDLSPPVHFSYPNPRFTPHSSLQLGLIYHPVIHQHHPTS